MHFVNQQTGNKLLSFVELCQPDPSVMTLLRDAGGCHLPAVAPLAPQDGQTRGEDHQEDDHDGKEDEGA